MTSDKISSGHSMSMSDGMSTNNSHHTRGMMMMPTFFQYHTPMTPMLFKEWPLSTIWGVVLAMLATFVFATLYEGLRYYVYVHSALQARGEKCPKNARRLKIVSRLSGSVLHMLHFTTGYVLMLAAMTYNVWIFISLIVGTTLGYFFIRPTVENCFKVIRKTKTRKKTPQKSVTNGCPTGSVKTSNMIYNTRYTLIESNDASKPGTISCTNSEIHNHLLSEKISVV